MTSKPTAPIDPEDVSFAHSISTRIWVLSLIVLAVTLGIQLLVPVPAMSRPFRTMALTVAVASGAWLLIEIVSQGRTRFFWRVRRQLVAVYALSAVAAIAFVAFPATLVTVRLLSGAQIGRATLIALGLLPVLFVGFLYWTLFGPGALGRRLVSFVHELFMATERVRRGDFEHRMRFRSSDQLGELSAAFDQMLDNLKPMVQSEVDKQALATELRIAANMQRALLPTQIPHLPGVSISARNDPTREIGGDYYDFFVLGDGSLAVVIADVAGKATSAVLQMAIVKGLLVSLHRTIGSPRQLLIELNRLVPDVLDSRSFITITYGVLDLGAGTFTVARAGHTPIMIVSADTPQNVMPDGLVLGLRIDQFEAKFSGMLEEYAHVLQHGDVIVLYTDGISETANSAGDYFGEQRLLELVTNHRNESADNISVTVYDALRTFADGAFQQDDMTLIVMKIEAPDADHASGREKRTD